MKEVYVFKYQPIMITIMKLNNNNLIYKILCLELTIQDTVSTASNKTRYKVLRLFQLVIYLFIYLFIFKLAPNFYYSAIKVVHFPTF